MKLKKIASLALAGVMAVSMLAGCNTVNNSGDDTVVPPAEDVTPAGYSATILDSTNAWTKSLMTAEDSDMLEKAVEAAASSVNEGDDIVALLAWTEGKIKQPAIASMMNVVFWGNLAEDIEDDIWEIDNGQSTGDARYALMCVYNRALNDTQLNGEIASVVNRAMQNQNHPKQIMRQQRKVANCNVLPAQYEQKLDEGCWSNLGDPLWAAIVMVKEGGLTPKVVCALRNKDIVAFGPDEDEVYVSYRRDDLASYTHDYTFPLTPFGGRYITLWLQHLKNNMPTDRTDGEKYLFSADDHGNVPLNASELHKFIYCQLNRYIFGYAGRVKLGALMISPSVKLLHNTREKHIREDCRFGTDTGAINFLLHRSLVNQVQADHYRCFVDETGRRSLWLRLCQTRHGLPPETPRRTRMSTIQRNGMIELHFPAKITDPGRDKLITVSLEGLIAGEVIVVKTRHGCYINTISQDGSTTSFAGGTTDSDDERAPGTP